MGVNGYLTRKVLVWLTYLHTLCWHGLGGLGFYVTYLRERPSL